MTRPTLLITDTRRDWYLTPDGRFYNSLRELCVAAVQEALK